MRYRIRRRVIHAMRAPSSAPGRISIQKLWPHTNESEMPGREQATVGSSHPPTKKTPITKKILSKYFMIKEAAGTIALRLVGCRRKRSARAACLKAPDNFLAPSDGIGLLSISRIGISIDVFSRRYPATPNLPVLVSACRCILGGMQGSAQPLHGATSELLINKVLVSFLALVSAPTPCAHRVPVRVVRAL